VRNLTQKGLNGEEYMETCSPGEASWCGMAVWYILLYLYSCMNLKYEEASGR
jgi:hypothetical protein